MIDANKTIAPHGKKTCFCDVIRPFGHQSLCIARAGGGGGGWRRIFFVGGSPGFEGEKRGISRRQQWEREGRGREGHKEYYRAIEEIW